MYILVFYLFMVSTERITQTVEITKHTVDIEEKGVKLKLTIVDTPGFGDAVNNTEWYVEGLTGPGTLSLCSFSVWREQIDFFYL